MSETTRGDAIAEELEQIADRLERLMPIVNEARLAQSGLSMLVTTDAASDNERPDSGGFQRLDVARMRIVRAIHGEDDPLWPPVPHSAPTRAPAERRPTDPLADRAGSIGLSGCSPR